MARLRRVFERHPGRSVDGPFAGQPLPALDDDITVSRFVLDEPCTPSGLLGRD